MENEEIPFYDVETAEIELRIFSTDPFYLERAIEPDNNILPPMQISTSVSSNHLNIKISKFQKLTTALATLNELIEMIQLIDETTTTIAEFKK